MTGTRYRRAAVVVGLAAGALLLGPPASAEVVEGPGEGEVLTAHASRTITTTFQGRGRVEVRNPANQVIAAAEGTALGGGEVSVVLNTACPAEPAEACAPTAPGANGQWSLRYVESVGGEAKQRPFFLRIGGTPPSDVAATLAERTVTVSWKPGPEPDVTRFAVSDGSITRTVGRDACSDGTCRTTIEYPAPATGERSFSVRALRPSGVEGEADVAGSGATTQPVALPAPPADPTAGPSAGATGSPGATPGTPGATGTPGAPGAGAAGPATAQSFAQGFSNFAPSLGLPKVPPLPATTAPQVAAPQVADTFESELGYGERESEPGGPDPIAAPSGRESVLQSTGGLLADEQLLRSIAGALVLLLAAGHLRTWLARSSTDDLA